jgi:probable rRNA maturation factor
VASSRINSTPRLRPPTLRPTRLHLDIHAKTGTQYIPSLKRHLLKAHAILNSPLSDLSIAIVAAKEMADLHQQFLNEPGPTDVLTFELEHNARNKVISGEIVICHTVAQTQARKLNHSVADELLLYALHGLLHLSGFDDRTPAAYKVMHAREDEILTRLGVGPLFSKRSA